MSANVTRITFTAIGSRWEVEKVVEGLVGFPMTQTSLDYLSPQKALALATEVLLAGAKPDGGSPSDLDAAIKDRLAEIKAIRKRRRTKRAS